MLLQYSQSVLGVDGKLTEMKFTTEQRVFIVESFVRKKLTENVSVSFVVNILENVSISFVVNILTHQFPQVRCGVIYLCDAIRSAIS
jgi:hypothetical protein